MVKEANMNLKAQSQKIMEMVFPNKKARKFLCNDLYRELLKLIPPQKCISPFNVVKRVRLNNLTFVKKTIIEFLTENKNYEDIVKSIYECDSINCFVTNRLILGLVFFIAKTNKELKNINITTDKCSVCYYDINMFHVLTGK